MTPEEWTEKIVMEIEAGALRPKEDALGGVKEMPSIIGFLKKHIQEIIQEEREMCARVAKKVELEIRESCVLKDMLSRKTTMLSEVGLEKVATAVEIAKRIRGVTPRDTGA